jgi:hypothetical protein
MNAEAIQELLHRRPFEPFEVHLSNGEIHQISNPEFAVVLKSNVFIGYPDSDRFALCSLLHIASLQRLQPEEDGSRRGEA